MSSKVVPQTTVYRLSLYLRQLERLDKDNLKYISSLQLSKKTGISDVQIRRDLNYFGKFGRSRLGYSIKNLEKNLRKILGIDKRIWRVVLVGAGNLGRALFSYKGFRERGFLIEAVFDSDPKKIGKDLNGIKIEDVKNLIPLIKKEKFDIAIIAVPAESAQNIALALIRAGIKAILNFAPVRLSLPSGIVLKNVDLSTELESISFYLTKFK